MVEKKGEPLVKESVFGRCERKFRRTEISGFECQIADGKTVFKGSVDDLSVQGFSLYKVPAALCDEAKIYKAIFSKDDSYYKVTITPQWSKPDSDGSGYHVGYKILDNDWKWVHFSMEILPGHFKKE